jgi:hypothetical protein
MAEDGEALLFAPIVDDVREQISIPAGWNSLKETPSLDLDAIRQAACLNQRGA